MGNKVPVRKQVFPRSVSQTIEYGDPSFLSLTLRNTGAAPARNVVITLSVPDMQVFDQLGDVLNPFQAVNIRGFPNYPGGALNMHFPVISSIGAGGNCITDTNQEGRRRWPSSIPRPNRGGQS
jgi:uncharacterized repeat protein (TIGR01451 family)